MSQPTAEVRIWDLPTRLFHWLLAACVLGSVVSAKADAMSWHFRFGYVVFALLVFRIVWGFVGGRWSRFGSFVRGPGTVLRYLRAGPGPTSRWTSATTRWARCRCWRSWRSWRCRSAPA